MLNCDQTGVIIVIFFCTIENFYIYNCAIEVIIIIVIIIIIIIIVIIIIINCAAILVSFHDPVTVW